MSFAGNAVVITLIYRRGESQRQNLTLEFFKRLIFQVCSCAHVPCRVLSSGIYLADLNLQNEHFQFPECSHSNTFFHLHSRTYARASSLIQYSLTERGKCVFFIMFSIYYCLLSLHCIVCLFHTVVNDHTTDCNLKQKVKKHECFHFKSRYRVVLSRSHNTPSNV